MRRQYITHPRFQYSFTFSFVLGVLLIVALVGGGAIGTLILLAKQTIISPAVNLALMRGVQELGMLLLIVGLPIGLLFLFLGIYFSYKLVGPLYRLEGWLELHLLGKKPPTLTLRPGDELEPISRAINQNLIKFEAQRKAR